MRCLMVVFLNESEIVFSVPLTNTILVIYVAECCTYRSSKLTKKTDGIAKRASSNDFEQEPEHDVLWVLNFSTLHPTDLMPSSQGESCQTPRMSQRESAEK